LLSAFHPSMLGNSDRANATAAIENDSRF